MSARGSRPKPSLPPGALGVLAQGSPGRLDALPDPAQLRRLRGSLVDWYRRDHRRLPWRSIPSPYRVWISEIMLQQTRVEVVVDYFERFVARFPDVPSLARAPLDEVLALWSGLGYYSRARNMHLAAQLVAERHGGEVPRNLDALMALPGVGRYTAGAIASIAFGLPAPIVDGNVVRVLTRLFDIADGVDKAPAQSRLWQLAALLVPEEAPGDFNQGLMELGATVCTPRSPACSSCPWAADCASRQRGTVLERPVKAAKRPPVPTRLAAVVLQDGAGNVLLRRRPHQGLFGGLWEPLVLAWAADTTPRAAEVAKRAADELPWLEHAYPLASVGRVAHVLSHRALDVFVFSARVHRDTTTTPRSAAPERFDDACIWASTTDMAELGVSRLVQKILHLVRPAQQGELFTPAGKE